MTNGVAANEDFTLTLRAYREDNAQTMLLDCGVDIIYFKPGGAIAVHAADGASWRDTGVSLPLNTWADVIIQSNRSEGTFTVFVQPVGGESAEGTLAKGIILKNVAVNGINLCATSNGTFSPYIDKVVLTKSEAVGVVADYLVALNPDVYATVGETVEVQLNVISNTKATYNTFRYELSYDADMLTYTGATSGVSVDSSTPGKLTVTGSGVDKAISDIVALTFTAREGGATKVTLDKAYVEETKTDAIESTGAELITYSQTAVTVSGYAVALPDDFVGAAGVAEGADYTFTAKDKNYEYSFEGSTMSGGSVDVTDNGNGTFTVKNVSGKLVIASEKTAKRFDVSVAGNAKTDVTADGTATYNEDYSFTVNMSADYSYSVHVALDGKAYDPEKDGSTYTIAGADITGDIVITVARTVIPSAPAIEGVENGGTYYGQLTVTVTDPDGDLAQVYLDGNLTTLQNGKLVVIPDSSFPERTVKAVDAEGTETTVVFTLHEKAVGDVVSMIAQIGEVTLADAELIEEARAAYDALTDAQKTLVNNLSELEAAEVILEELKNAKPELNFHSVSLKGNIGINYYMDLPEVVLTDADAYMQFAVEGKDPMKVPVADAIEETVEGKTYYVFTCEVPAKEMNDIITAQFFYGDGKSTEAEQYSVAAYAYEILEDTTGAYDEVKPLVEAMLNYGAAAQNHFDHNTEDPANAGLDQAPDYSGITAETLAPYVGTGSGSDDAPFYGSSLLLKGETSLRFFFEVAEGAEFTATCGGKALDADIRGGLHYVTVENISAKDLDKMITVVANGSEVTASALTYAYNVLSAAEGTYSGDLITLVKALYAYNQAANAYFGE